MRPHELLRRALCNKLEMQVGEFLCEIGFRYRAHDSTLPGNPDFVHENAKCVVFLNRCFQHFCRVCVVVKLRAKGVKSPEQCYDAFVSGCHKAARTMRRVLLPAKSNSILWQRRVLSNVQQDKKNLRSLVKLGYKPLVLWEHDVKRQKEDVCLNTVKILRQTLIVNATKYLWKEYGEPGDKIPDSRYYRAYCMFCFVPVRCCSKFNAKVNYAFCEVCHPDGGEQRLQNRMHCGTRHQERDSEDVLLREMLQQEERKNPFDGER